MSERHSHIDPQKAPPWYRSRAGLAFAGFAAVAALLLIYEHRLHIPFGNLLAVLPLIACFGLHSFMHGGHGGHGGHRHSGSPRRPAEGSKAADGENQQ